jgi:predicted XRE-type DNA-binding protein
LRTKTRKLKRKLNRKSKRWLKALNNKSIQCLAVKASQISKMMRQKHSKFSTDNLKL